MKRPPEFFESPGLLCDLRETANTLWNNPEYGDLAYQGLTIMLDGAMKRRVDRALSGEFVLNAPDLKDPVAISDGGNPIEAVAEQATDYIESHRYARLPFTFSWDTTLDGRTKPVPLGRAALSLRPGQLVIPQLAGYLEDRYLPLHSQYGAVGKSFDSLAQCLGITYCYKTDREWAEPFIPFDELEDRLTDHGVKRVTQIRRGITDLIRQAFAASTAQTSGIVLNLPPDGLDQGARYLGFQDIAIASLPYIAKSYPPHSKFRTAFLALHKELTPKEETNCMS